MSHGELRQECRELAGLHAFARECMARLHEQGDYDAALEIAALGGEICDEILALFRLSQANGPD